MATQAEVAEKLGISDRWLRELTGTGVVKDPGRGKWDALETAKQLLEHRSREIDRLKAELASARAQVQRADSDTANKAQEDARLARAKAEMAEIKAKEMRGELVPADQIADAVHSAVIIMKTRLNAIPSRAAPTAHAAPSVAAAESIIREQVDEALAELGNVKVLGAA